MTTTPNCSLCNGKLHWEVICGIRLFREINGRKVYAARCLNCNRHYTVTNGIKQIA